MSDTTALETHFRFGENWADYAQRIAEPEIAQATADMARLVGPSIAGKTFLDIGCGSGLHALAALRLGAASVTAIDIDPASVSTTRTVLGKHAAGQAWDARVVSVLDRDFAALGQFDVVYSWGVLHHTGAMWKAIDAASSHVAPGGIFALALYRETPVCWAWKIEKRIYSRAPKLVQGLVRGAYNTAYAAGLAATGRSPFRYFAEYRSNRGMNWQNDAHDWLGGYPYESTAPEAVTTRLKNCGFKTIYSDDRKAPMGGLLGTPCFEQVLRKE